MSDQLIHSLIPEVGRVYAHVALEKMMPRPFCDVVVDAIDDHAVVVRVPGNPADESQSVPLDGFFDDYRTLVSFDDEASYLATRAAEAER
jgi:hypothetical protein